MKHILLTSAAVLAVCAVAFTQTGNFDEVLSSNASAAAQEEVLGQGAGRNLCTDPDTGLARLKPLYADLDEDDPQEFDSGFPVPPLEDHSRRICG